MATVLDSLKGVNAYPIPLRTFEEVAGKHGLTLTAEATQTVLTSAGYNLALADLLRWLILAPDVSQGGQSYSFTDEQRLQMRVQADNLYDEYGPQERKAVYGYKGSRF